MAARSGSSLFCFPWDNRGPSTAAKRWYGSGNDKPGFASKPMRAFRFSQNEVEKEGKGLLEKLINYQFRTN